MLPAERALSFSYRIDVVQVPVAPDSHDSQSSEIYPYMGILRHPWGDSQLSNFLELSRAMLLVSPTYARALVGLDGRGAE